MNAPAVVQPDATNVITAKLGTAGLVQAAEIAAIAEALNFDLPIKFIESKLSTHMSANVVTGLGSFEDIDWDGNRLLAEDVIGSEFGII